MRNNLSNLSTNQSALFCVACANSLVPTSAICPKCGTPRAHLPNQAGVTGLKSKTVSVLLAVFFSFWTYLYSYKTDKTKFWLSLAASLFTFSIALLFLSISVELLFIGFFDFDGLTYFFVQLFCVLMQIAIWVTSIVVSAKKPSNF